MIAAFKDHKHLFETSMTAEAVYNKIRQTIEEHNFYYTTEQTRKKFSKLKMEYTAIEEHNRQTGVPPKTFQYKSEFDEIFKKDHSVNPTRLASSLNYDLPSKSNATVKTAENDDEIEMETIVPKKRKVNHTDQILLHMNEVEERRELKDEDRERKREERSAEKSRQREAALTILEESNNIMKTFMTKLLEKI